jgi:hypothetical protein
VRLLRCTAQVLRGVFVKYYDRVATVRLRKIFLSTARPCERGARPAAAGPGAFVARGRGPWASQGPRDATLMPRDATPGQASPAGLHFTSGGRTRARCGPARRQRANPAPRHREGVAEGAR